VDACNDHRIAMSATVASVACPSPITLLGAEAVNKSYPAFYRHFEQLGGRVKEI
jgi:3-phosphoshikimate 1-carboxyvinyltransferase